MGAYKVLIRTERGDELKPEYFETEAHAVEWSVSQLAKTGHNYQVVNLKQDPNWVKEAVEKKRAKEERSIEKKVEAIIKYFEDQPEELTELLFERENLRVKYPDGEV